MNHFSLALALAVICGPAHAMSPCAPRDILAKMLGDRFGEHRQGMGRAGDTAIVELYASAKTWTLVTTDKNGVSCIVGAGDSWESEKYFGDPA